MSKLYLLLLLLGQSGYAGSPVDCIDKALSLSNINNQSVLFDIGSGDGRVVAIASKIYKCKSVGIELDKNLFELSKKTIIRNGLSSLVELRNEDALKSDLSRATHIYLYHQSDFLNKLRPQLEKLKKESVIICLDYPLPWRKNSPILKMQSIDGHEHSIYIYKDNDDQNANDSDLVKAGKIYVGVRFYEGLRHPLLVQLAEDYSKQMAAINSQSYRGVGHFGVEKRYSIIRQELGLKGNEVSAESWYWRSNSPMDIVSKEMFDSWKYSSGHWRIVSAPHRLYGDAIAKSKHGIYYAVILVAD